jgi:hypothetical protein
MAAGNVGGFGLRVKPQENPFKRKSTVFPMQQKLQAAAGKFDEDDDDDTDEDSDLEVNMD